ncbi:MAG: hypothetical protein EA428_06665 [Spirochaetaceae bacterium]|nr:MAG: hypothetical protein EA428_06665 [Spirochaetaceae bacterium]
MSPSTSSVPMVNMAAFTRWPPELPGLATEPKPAIPSVQGSRSRVREQSLSCDSTFFGIHSTSMVTTATPRRMLHTRGLVCAMMLAVLLLSAPAGVTAQTSGELPGITVGAEPDYPPYSFLDDDGVPTGFSVELFQAVARSMGLSIDLHTDYWVNLKGDLAEGSIDALPLVGRTPEREELFDFTFPYLSLHGGIVVRNDDYRFAELEDLQGARIAVMAGDNAEEFLRRQTEAYDIATFPTFSAAMRDLSAGNSDAVVIQRLVALRLLQEEAFANLRLLNEPITEFRQDFCFAVTKGNGELLAVLNEGLARVIADGTLRRLEIVWFSPLELPARSIIVGGDHNYPPFEYLDDEGNTAGYNVDLIQAIAREMGLNIEIRLGPWTQITTMLERGEIDLILGMMYSAERDRIFDFSPAHTVHQHVAIARQSRDGRQIPGSEEELRGHRIAVQAGDIMHEFALEKGLTDDLVVVESQEEALELVLIGEVDYALGSRLTAMYLIEKNGWDRLNVGQRSFVNREYGFAVKKGNTGLLSFFSEGLSVIERTGEYRRIHNEWLGVYVPSEYDLSRIVYSLLFIFVPGVLFLLLVIIWNYSLRKQVNLRTAELTVSLEEKQILLKEIHHRVKNNLNVIVSLLRLQEDQIDTIESAREAFEQSRNRIFSMALVHESLYQSDSLSDIQLDEYVGTLVAQLETNHLRSGQITYSCNLTPVRLDITQAVPCGIIINELVTNAQKHAFVGLPGGEITVSVQVADTGSADGGRHPAGRPAGRSLVITVEDNGRGIAAANGGTSPAAARAATAATAAAPATAAPATTSTTSLGMHLVHVLTDQLNGSVEIGSRTDGSTGTRAVLTLPFGGTDR